MRRDKELYLDQWKNRTSRKPLVIRGARQVGKTYLAENWGRANFEAVVTVNLEKETSLSKVFSSKDPASIIQQIALIKQRKIIPSRTLLLIDEIQNSEDAIASLRYFYEEMPELHVMATGSLLDFALRSLSLPAPVGRIEFLYLNPLNFSEFVGAVHGEDMAAFLESDIDLKAFPLSVHETLLGLLRHYYFIGGMPEAVKLYAQTRDLIEVQRAQSNILSTFKDDFSKYRTRLNLEAIDVVFEHCTRFPARRSKYTEIARDLKASQLRQAFDLLSYARLVHRTYVSSANGVPVAAEKNPKLFKPLFLDIGLCNRASGLPLLNDLTEILTVREGMMAEQFVGQELLASYPPFEDPQLFYWEREAQYSSAEIDYLLEVNNRVVPVEVKAARGGAMRSLLLFAEQKKSNFALRLSTREPKTESISTKNNEKLTLQSLPLYLAGQARSLINVK